MIIPFGCASIVGLGFIGLYGAITAYDNMLVSPACGNCVNSGECKNAEKLGWCSNYEFSQDKFAIKWDTSITV